MSANKKYSKELKTAAVKMYLDGYPVKEIMEKYEINDRKRINVWAKKYNSGDKEFEDKRGKNSTGRPKAIKDKSEMTKDEYIAFLEMENDILKMMAEMEID